MLEAQKILHLSQMNNQATDKHRKENEDNVGLYIFFFCFYEHIKCLFIFTVYTCRKLLMVSVTLPDPK